MFNLLLQFLQNVFLQPFFLPLLLFVLFVCKAFALKSGIRKNQPPSPRKLPIIGNLHQVGPSLHHSFRSLSQRYGKLMLLHLGKKPTFVVSSADGVREIMKTHDLIFANRPESRVARRIFYDYKDVAFAPYGEHWRQMKRISVLHLLSNQKVQSFRAIREDETAVMVERISRSRSSVVNLSEIVMSYTNDVICRAAFGRKYSSRSDGGAKFQELINEAIQLLGVVCLGDFIPCLSWVDRLKGLNDRVEIVANELDEFLESVIQEHELHLIVSKDVDHDKCDEGKKVRTFVDILLEYQEENRDALSRDNIKAVIMDIFLAGTETNYALIEWTMSELIRHPRIMTELKEEVRKVRGRGHMVCEDDLEKLTYLKAVIKEALRLHPPVPLLLLREASEDVKVHGFDIAAGTQVAINAWAIHRDSTYWEEPEKFHPERFRNNSATSNLKGQDNFEYIPFGGGRRICPGISFAMVNAEVVVANLINEFDWILPGVGAKCEDLDMTESLGINVHRRDPLMVIATPYSR